MLPLHPDYDPAAPDNGDKLVQIGVQLIHPGLVLLYLRLQVFIVRRQPVHPTLERFISRFQLLNLFFELRHLGLSLLQGLIQSLGEIRQHRWAVSSRRAEERLEVITYQGQDDEKVMVFQFEQSIEAFLREWGMETVSVEIIAAGGLLQEGNLGGEESGGRAGSTCKWFLI